MAQVVRRRAMSSDRAGESMERDEVKRDEFELIERFQICKKKN